MGARGPKPKHPALKLVGKRAADASVKATGRIRRGLPDCPRELTGEAAAEWAHLAETLHEAGTLAVTDRGILAAYCLAVQDLLAARAEVERVGRWIEEVQQSSTGNIVGKKVREHPAVKMIDRASARIQKLGAALGLNPEARSRQEGLSAPEAPKGNAVVTIRDRIQAARK